jgi:hypothetical protein
MSTLQDASLGNLKFRKMLLEAIIRDYKDDPRVGEPKRQLKIIDEEISRRENESESEEVVMSSKPSDDDERPPDLVVGLDTLELKGITRKS